MYGSRHGRVRLLRSKDDATPPSGAPFCRLLADGETRRSARPLAKNQPSPLPPSCSQETFFPSHPPTETAHLCSRAEPADKSRRTNKTNKTACQKRERAPLFDPLLYSPSRAPSLPSSSFSPLGTRRPGAGLLWVVRKKRKAGSKDVSGQLVRLKKRKQGEKEWLPSLPFFDPRVRGRDKLVCVWRAANYKRGCVEPHHHHHQRACATQPCARAPASPLLIIIGRRRRRMERRRALADADGDDGGGGTREERKSGVSSVPAPSPLSCCPRCGASAFERVLSLVLTALSCRLLYC
jgi:hypothetical protein